MADDGFSAEERAAMKARAAELTASTRRGSGAKKAAADAQDCVDRIAEMPEADRDHCRGTARHRRRERS